MTICRRCSLKWGPDRSWSTEDVLDSDYQHVGENLELKKELSPQMTLSFLTKSLHTSHHTLNSASL